MGIDIRSCRSDELEQLILLLDEEFIFGKGRTISLQLRFPTVFCHNNLHNILVCVDDEEIASALAMRQFDWRDDDKILSGAMIGAVYTHPSRRKHGWASRLLAAAAMQLQARGIDFGVLWTGQPSFYDRFGWIAADCSVIGEVETSMPIPESPDEVIFLSVEGSAPQLEITRQNWLNTRVLRRPEDYHQLPLPAEHVDVLWREDQGKVAYALLGSSGETGFLYELVGDASCFPALWRETCRFRQHIFINDRIDNSSYRWLTEHVGVNWKKKNLAMWLPLSKRMDISRLRQWHIPYFDRI